MKSEEIKKIDAKNVEKNDKNNKGFTLIELLATISILAIIMLMAIPNVIGIVQRNKNKQYVEDAKKLVTLAKYEVRKNKPANNPETYTLDKLDKSDDIKDGPNGSDYNRTGSGVTVTKDESKYTYQVTLYEGKDDKAIGLFEVSETDLYKANAVNLVKTKGKNNVPSLPYSTTTTTLTDKVPTLTLSSKKCTSSCTIKKNQSYDGYIILSLDGTYDTSKVGITITGNLSGSLSIGGTYGGVSPGNYYHYGADATVMDKKIRIDFDISSSNTRTGEVKVKVPAGIICGANKKCNKEQIFSTGVTVSSGSGTYY